MFKEDLEPQKITEMFKNTLMETLGISIVKVTKDCIYGQMPVNERVHQPFGVLHGGASVAFAESLGSVASNFLIDESKMAVGLEINANHLRPVKSGFVYGKVLPVHIGSKTHVWNIEISNEAGKMVCISRITVMIVDK